MTPLFGQPIEPMEPKYSSAFEFFWEMSTKRGSKLAASKSWGKLLPLGHLKIKIHNGMVAWMQSDQWQDERMQPHVSTWLNRRGWEEIVPRRRNADNFDRAAFFVPHTEHLCSSCAKPHVWPCDKKCDLTYSLACPEYFVRLRLKSVKL